MNKILIFLLFLPVASSAVNWIDLGKTNDKQFQNFLDYDSVKRQDVKVFGNSSSWQFTNKLKYISAVFQATYINDNPLRKKGFYYSKQQWFISCEDQTFFMNAKIDYGFKNEVVNSWQSKKKGLSESDFSYAFPETAGGDAIEQACAAISIKETDFLGSYEEYMESLILENDQN